MNRDNLYKKILLISPIFFGYYEEMIKELQLMNYEVDFICDAPSNSNISKAIGRVNKNLLKSVTKRYFNNYVLPLITKKQYDYVLVIGGMTFAFTPEMVCKIKQMNKKAKFIMYQWDSERNLPYSKGIHEFFDDVYSFDRYDCMNNNMYKFLPLFYTKNYEEIGSKEVESYKYCCSYIGTAHPKKVKEINDIVRATEDIFPKQYIYHYMPSKLKYIYHKIFAPEFKELSFSDFQTKKMSSNQVMKVFSESQCILDAPQAGQTGLTIRTIECLGAKRKMITTNNDIRYYDFYREENILIYNGTIDKNNIFFKSQYVDIKEETYKKYSLRSWLKTMLK